MKIVLESGSGSALKSVRIRYTSDNLFLPPCRWGRVWWDTSSSLSPSPGFARSPGPSCSRRFPSFLVRENHSHRLNGGVKSPKFILAACVQLYSLAETPHPSSPLLHLGSYMRALLVSQNRRHLFVTPLIIRLHCVKGTVWPGGMYLEWYHYIEC